MTGTEINQLYSKLEAKYPDGGYVSRASIFIEALRDGTISKEVVKEAKKYYGNLWNYVGD